MLEPKAPGSFPNKRFWAVLQERHPVERARRVMNTPFFWQRHLPDLDLVVTMFVAPDKNRCGVFLGENGKLGIASVEKRLAGHADEINAALGLDPEASFPGFPFVSRWNVNCYAEDNWPAMVDWLVTEASRYERALREILAERPA